MSDTTNIEKREVTRDQAERTRSGCVYVPPVDIIEKGDELLLLADVPGARPDDIGVHYEQGELRIVARVTPRQDENTHYRMQEYGIGDYERTFQIGEAIDADRIHAEVSAGVLTLHLPKSEAARLRRIPVKSA